VEIRALSWNLFHGRAESGRAGRELFREFASVLAEADWDLALLQECPPRWSESLAGECDATVAHRVLTSRNWLTPLRSALARRNPDLLGSWEGGSNLTVVRGRLAKCRFGERRSLLLRRFPERRRMAFVRVSKGLCIANVHASKRRALAEGDVLLAAERAVAWADGSPLIFGGDLNLRPERSRVLAKLKEQFGLGGAIPRSIDHILARGVVLEKPADRWPATRREVDSQRGRLRLSDHSPVEGVFRLR